MLPLVLALLPTAEAVECLWGQQLADVVDAQYLRDPVSVVVTDECFVDNTVTIADAVGLSIECATEGCLLPPMSIKGSIVTIKDGTFTTDHQPDVSSTYGDLADVLPFSVALYAQGSELNLVGTGATGLTDADGAAVLAIDTSVTVTGGQFVDLAGGGVGVVARRDSIAVDVQGTSFTNVGLVGLYATNQYAVGGGAVTTLRVEDATFSNPSIGFGDILAHVDAFEHVNTGHNGTVVTMGVAPVYSKAAAATVQDANFSDTKAEFGAGTFWFEGTNKVSIEGGTFSPDEGSDYAIKFNRVTEASITGGLWEPGAAIVSDGGSLRITGVRFRLPYSDLNSALLYVDGVTLDFEQNSVCAEERLASMSLGILMAYNSTVTLNGNVFQTTTLPAGALIYASTYSTGSSFLEVTDNTFVEIGGAALLAGQFDTLDFRNNLTYDSVSTVMSDEAPGTLTTGYNLWYSERHERVLLDGWGSADLFDVEPTFAFGYTPACSDEALGQEAPVGPAPGPDSPVIDAGSKDLPDSEDGTRSDIGAIDFDHRIAPDTGDTGEPDTGEPDTGAAPDCADADDPGTEADENCDGRNSTLEYGGGCAFGSLGFAVGPLALLWRRRRPGAAVRGGGRRA